MAQKRRILAFVPLSGLAGRVHDEVMELFIAFTALTIIGIAAQFFGNDSREGFDPPRPEYWNLPEQHA
jgi:hypothetical protein